MLAAGVAFAVEAFAEAFAGRLASAEEVGVVVGQEEGIGLVEARVRNLLDHQEGRYCMIAGEGTPVEAAAVGLEGASVGAEEHLFPVPEAECCHLVVAAAVAAAVPDLEGSQERDGQQVLQA